MTGPLAWVRVALALPVLVGLRLVAPAPGDDAPALPRYCLKVGQELVYRGGSSFQYQNWSLDHKNLDRAWVSRENSDGSWRVVLCFRDTATPTMVDQRNQPKAKLDDADMTDAHLGVCDLFPDGRVRLDESITESYQPTNPDDMFPPLPADLAQAKGTWQLVRTGMAEGQTVYRMADQMGARVIAAEKHSLIDKIKLSSATLRYTFDPVIGVMSRIDSTNTKRYGPGAKGTGELVLDKVVDHDAAWAEAMDREANAYFAAQKAHREAMTRVSQVEGDIKPLLATAYEPLKAARGRLTIPAFVGAIEAQIEQEEAIALQYANEAEAKRKIIGQDAADWELKDLAGATHTMRQYRGRVVVLDFWYRGCGPCIQSMPQMKQLADDFRDWPVAILGMNIDDTEDAQFVVDVMGLNYPTIVGVLNEPEKYHVRGFPTLVVVDPHGKVAEFQVGYSPTLRTEIGAMVRRLLPSDPKAAHASPKGNY